MDDGAVCGEVEVISTVHHQSLGARSSARLVDGQMERPPQRQESPDVKSGGVAECRAIARVHECGAEARLIGDGVVASCVDVREDTLQLSSPHVTVEDRRRDGGQQLRPAGHPAGGLEDVTDLVSPRHPESVATASPVRG
jgi:hypothetical protein